ncbi:MAG: cytochrome c biogenesis protein CcdA [Halofilum sp. (in: g-proteobacteria)]|nr:cytochrome c biogenesis protein CcdA [Halofilum sp. (in: g-proteobacteria)]
MTGWELGYGAALLAGVISFLSPCVLPLVPGYLAFIAGQASAGPGDATVAADTRIERRLAPVAFVLGFSLVFILMGAGATAAGQLLLQYRYEANLVGGAVVVVFGILMTGLVQPTWLLRDYRPVHLLENGGSVGAAGLLGVAFGVGWTPCIGPILGGILTVAATRTGALSGIGLLATYAAGLAIPFLAAAAFTERFTRTLSHLRRWGRWLHVVSGGVLVIVGLAMMTGQLTVFAYWLIEVFPALGRIG